MKASTIRFGTKRYYSPLSLTQIRQEVQQITTVSKWFRNPFATVKELFEGEVGFSTFDLNYRTILRSDRAFPKIVGRFITNDAGRSEVELTLKRNGKEWTLSVMMAFGVMLMLTIAVTLRIYPLYGFAAAMGILLAMRYLPNQRMAAEIFTLLQLRLQLTSIPEPSLD